MVDLWRLGIAIFLFPLTILIEYILEDLGHIESAGIAAILGLISFIIALIGSLLDNKKKCND
ncbi:MAG: hypothetical protein J7L82_03935 [Staphylothermus sp.]|nr:hypothetical protein [Staphylothermus sp.]